MKDLFLIPVMLAVFAFGFYIMARVDRFIENNRRLIADGERRGQSRVCIAAESTALLGAIGPALESCSHAEPHIGFFLSSGRPELILEKLLAEKVDIVLLLPAAAPIADERYAMLSIPCECPPQVCGMSGLPVEISDKPDSLWVVWKKDTKSKDRNRVIFALENEL